MSISSPQSRADLKEYIKTKLGAPVLQINVSDEQMDIAIDDAFQWFYERQHFDAMERVYLSVKVSNSLYNFFQTGELENIEQSDTQPVYADGMVQTLTLVTPGTGYGPTTNTDGDMIATTTTGGTGEKLTVTPGTARTVDGGITNVALYNVGSGYTVGDQITLDGGNNDCVFQVTEITTSSPLYGTEEFKRQNNYLILPKDVVGVNRIIRPRAYAAGLAFGGVPFGALWAGTLFGAGQVGGSNFDLTSYYTMSQYLETLEWTIFPPVGYNFNKRSHRLFINSEDFGSSNVGDYLVMECDVKVSADMYDDIWNDMFLKRMSVAYTQLAWGRNLTKYQQVQLPGGISMNGDQIYNDAKAEISEIQERFALDYADPVLDVVG